MKNGVMRVELRHFKRDCMHFVVVFNVRVSLRETIVNDCVSGGF